MPNEPDSNPLDESKLQSERQGRVLAEYERAQDAAYHSDAIIYEVAAIIWSGNALLLGFILEAPSHLGIQLVVAALSILGILTSVFVVRTQSLSKIGQRIAYEICRRIETDTPLTYKLHCRIDAVYPKRAAQHWICGITAAFIAVWAVVLLRAAYLICKLAPGISWR